MMDLMAQLVQLSCGQPVTKGCAIMLEELIF